MRYKRPTDAECVDILSDHETLYMIATRATDRMINRRARRKAWEAHCAAGPLAQVRSLVLGEIGASVLLRGYTSSKQVSVIMADAKRHEGARFASKVERHELSDEILGVRVTYLGPAPGSYAR